MERVDARRDEEQSDCGIQTNSLVPLEHVRPRPEIDPVDKSAYVALGWIATQRIGIGLRQVGWGGRGSRGNSGSRHCASKKRELRERASTWSESWKMTDDGQSTS